MEKNFNVLEVEKYLIITNNSCTLLIIINPSGEIIINKKDIEVTQFYYHNYYISVKENNGFAGVYKYDGSIVLPFEFESVFMNSKGVVVSKDSSDTIIPYKELLT